MYEAVKSFTGIITMTIGERREIADVTIANDLLRAGYIKEVNPAEKVKRPRKKK